MDLFRQDVTEGLGEKYIHCIQLYKMQTEITQMYLCLMMTLSGFHGDVHLTFWDASSALNKALDSYANVGLLHSPSLKLVYICVIQSQTVFT